MKIEIPRRDLLTAIQEIGMVENKLREIEEFPKNPAQQKESLMDAQDALITATTHLDELSEKLKDLNEGL